MRARNIKPSICDNELLGAADLHFTVLFERLWMMADREGRLEDRPLRIKGHAFRYRDGLDVEPMLKWLDDNDFIQRYVVDEVPYIQVIKFLEHQKPHQNEKDSVIPAPPVRKKAKASTTTGPRKHDQGSKDLALNPSSLNPESGILTADCLMSPSETLVASDRDDHALTVFVHWQREWKHPGTRLDKKRRARIEARLKDFTADQLCEAVSGFRHSAWHTGTDPKGQGVVYDSIDCLLRDSGQVERGIGLFANPPRAPPKAETAGDRLLRNLNGDDNSRVIEHDAEYTALAGR